MKTLPELLEQLVDDPRVGPIHLCMYMAIWQCWERSGWVEAFEVRRGQLMRMAKIRAKTTYYRVMGELKEMGYVKYWPERYRKEGTVVGVNSSSTPSRAEIPLSFACSRPAPRHPS